MHEMYFYIIFAAFLRAPEKWLPALLLAWTILVTIGYGIAASTGLLRTFPAIRVTVSPLTLEFILGCTIALLIYRGRKQHGVLVLGLGIGLFLMSCILWTRIAPNAQPNGWGRVALFGIPWSLVVYGAVALEQSAGMLFSRPLRAIGDASYSIYLSHVLVIATLGRIWSLFATDGLADNILMTVVMLAAVVGTGYVSYLFIERSLLNRTRRNRVRKRSDMLVTAKCEATPTETSA